MNIGEKSKDEIDEILKQQDRRRLTDFQIMKLEKEAKRNWDIFYKNNSTKFFKDRHWTLREFHEIIEKADADDSEERLTLLEAGCGVGNFVFPLLEEVPRLFVYGCDFSTRAVDFMKSHPDYKDNRVRGFTCDLTDEDCFSKEEILLQEKVDFGSMIFVLSAISPAKHHNVIKNISSVLKPGSILFFRDYGRYDMAQLRFKAGKKIDENFYVRQDGTRSYYFTTEEVISLFTRDNQFKCIECEYVNRRTVNIKEQIDVGRIFVQGKFSKI